MSSDGKQSITQTAKIFDKYKNVSATAIGVGIAGGYGYPDVYAGYPVGPYYGDCMA
jgi:hypothetical protein